MKCVGRETARMVEQFEAEQLPTAFEFSRAVREPCYSVARVKPVDTYQYPPDPNIISQRSPVLWVHKLRK